MDEDELVQMSGDNFAEEFFGESPLKKQYGGWKDNAKQAFQEVVTAIHQKGFDIFPPLKKANYLIYGRRSLEKKVAQDHTRLGTIRFSRTQNSSTPLSLTYNANLMPIRDGKKKFVTPIPVEPNEIKEGFFKALDKPASQNEGLKPRDDKLAYFPASYYSSTKSGVGDKEDQNLIIPTDTVGVGGNMVKESATSVSSNDYTVGSIIEDGCFLPQEALTQILARVEAKKNLVLQGPPGTGKTWLAKRLAYVLLGSKDSMVTRKHLHVVQFHPSLSYEDFVRGWRPAGDGKLSLNDGVFLEIVKAAMANQGHPFVLVIEEINRGNPAQIFGELLTLLEDTKRNEEEAIALAYRRETDERIYIPPNLYVIGTMNIADRSLALVDLALRRRFAFFTLEPQFNSLWGQWCRDRCGLKKEEISLIEERMSDLNKAIEQDRSLGTQYRIGHSYVTPHPNGSVANGLAWFRDVVRTEIAPLLDEYWFDAPNKVRDAVGKLLEGL
jgi:MoxR-like ATPase